MKRLVIILSVAICGLFGATAAYPCTTFVLQGGGRIYFGRNLDWHWEDGFVVINRRNIEKTAFVAAERPAANWTSKYGSVTFNQFGCEMPFGGMNEAGLVVETSMLMETKYPAADSRPEINMLQWVQYQLDNCRTVAEVIATDKQIRLEQPTLPARIHYLVCDAEGDCATIEYLDGALVCHRGPDLPWRALANSTYQQCAAHLRAQAAAEDDAAPPKDGRSLSRFARAAARAGQFTPASVQQDMQYACDTLEQVCQEHTVWRIVYDVSAREIHYQTRGNPQPRKLALKGLEFSYARQAQFVDIAANPNATGRFDFQDLTEARQRKYLEGFIARESVKKRFGDLSKTIESLLRTLQGYKCAGGQPGDK